MATIDPHPDLRPIETLTFDHIVPQQSGKHPISNEIAYCPRFSTMPPMPTRKFNPQAEQAKMMRLLGLGITFGSELIAGLAVGWLLDTWLDTGHLFLIIGTLMGLIVGGIGFIRSAMKATREAAKSVQEQSGPSS